MRVSKQTKIGFIIAAAFAILIGGELAFEWWRGSEVVIQVENAGTTPIENLVVSYGESRSLIPLIAPETSVKIFVNGNDSHPLGLNFQQAGNPLSSFELPEFSPARLAADGLMLNVRIRPNSEIERYGDESDEVGSPLGRRVRSVQKWFRVLFFGDESQYRR